jgi:hypothetical protein
MQRNSGPYALDAILRWRVITRISNYSRVEECATVEERRFSAAFSFEDDGL